MTNDEILRAEGLDLTFIRYQAFRKVRHIRDTECKDREGKKFLTRVMRRLKEEVYD